LIPYDNASPDKIATSTVDISIVRNPSAPIFTLPSYEVTIPQTYSLGSPVVNVTAYDPDGVSISLLSLWQCLQLL